MFLSKKWLKVEMEVSYKILLFTNKRLVTDLGISLDNLKREFFLRKQNNCT